jgi:hypothetical protein
MSVLRVRAGGGAGAHGPGRGESAATVAGRAVGGRRGGGRDDAGRRGEPPARSPAGCEGLLHRERLREPGSRRAGDAVAVFAARARRGGEGHGSIAASASERGADRAREPTIGHGGEGHGSIAAAGERGADRAREPTIRCRAAGHTGSGVDRAQAPTGRHGGGRRGAQALTLFGALRQRPQPAPHFLDVPARMAACRHQIRHEQTALSVPLDRARRQPQRTGELGRRHEPSVCHAITVGAGQVACAAVGADGGTGGLDGISPLSKITYPAYACDLLEYSSIEASATGVAGTMDS